MIIVPMERYHTNVHLSLFIFRFTLKSCLALIRFIGNTHTDNLENLNNQHQ